MSEMLKKPYKITLWEDRNVYIVNGQKKYQLEENDVVQNQYLEEVCIATIGSDTMDTPIRALNPILTEELNGSKTFTFTIYSRYWDDKDEVFKDNPFTKLLVNERKVKLKYDTEWYDFVIKQVQENSENYTYTYTCKDLFVNELGKTGYSVELDVELENNMGTVTELAETILNGTDWQVGASDTLIQKNKENLYSYVLQDDLTNVKYYLNNNDYSPSTIAAGQVILIFYSSKANYENPVQFLYKPGGDYSTVDEAIANFYQVDEYGFVKDCDNLIATLPNNWIEASSSILQPINMFGEKMLRKQETRYIPQLGEVCGAYTRTISNIVYEFALPKEDDNPNTKGWYELNNNTYTLSSDTEVDPEKTYYIKNTYNQTDKYYAYTELEYASVAEIQSMISNGSGFISTNGWIAADSSSSVTLSSALNNSVYESALTLSGTVYNTGFYDNRAALSPNGFTAREKYVLMTKGGSLGNESYLKLVGAAGNSSINQYLVFSESLPSNITVDSTLTNGYTIKVATCNTSIPYSNLLNNYSDMQFYINLSGNLIDCKIFKLRVDENNQLIIPDLQTDADSIIKTRYNFFLENNIPNSAIWTKQDLEISATLLEDEISSYEPIIINGCEKVTSITGSKSNRFNLIQSLCEAFECWAKFSIDHDEIGRILYEYIPLTSATEFKLGARYYTMASGATSTTDDSVFTIVSEPEETDWQDYYKKVYHKYVSFKEYIGENNLVGFRYGINLKSIQRNIVSDQIASKVIVQPNTNEFAPNGSCTIQQSILNPTGENALYNFQYFVNQNLLDGLALNDDLYGMNGGLGFFSKMREYNDNLKPYINQLTEISQTLYTLQSRQAVYDAMMTEAERLLTETRQELTAAGYTESGTNGPEYIKTLRNRIKTYQGTINHYNGLNIRNATLVSAYETKYNDVQDQLDTIKNQKDQLNNDFENKYYRFIQEGTWTSGDYWDPELYYQAASQVLYTSSFPQVSYTINVLEISQVEGFEPYKFKIADKTYIEDTEFFGYDRQGRPYKEEIVISQVKSNLDDPSQNTITVRNYKTQFQDLFQRMAATSQSLQYHEGEYNRAASAINDDGTINSALMQNSLEANALIIQNAKNQSVTWDESGITISNYLNANDIVRLTSGGIAMTVDGGKNWTTGITGDGINADVITAGRIDTDRIRIFNEHMQQTFEWNDTGINAYMWDNSINNGIINDEGDPVPGAVNYGKFVRFDQYGLYGYAGGNVAWVPQNVSDVINNSMFSLTWKGLNINIPNSQDMPVISIGSLQNGDAVFQIDGSGNIYMRGGIELGGNITWTDNTTPIKTLYSPPGSNDPIPSTPTGVYSSYPLNSTTDWHQNFNSAIDEYISYSYVGGTANSWTAAAKYVAKDGEPGTTEVLKLYAKSALDTPALSSGQSYEDFPTAASTGLISDIGTYGWIKSDEVLTSGSTDIVYESTNQGKASTNSVVKITFTGTSFTLKIKSSAEGNNDYVIVSTLDAERYPTKYNDAIGSTSIVQDHTRGRQNSVRTVSFSGASNKEHYFYVVFRKDASTDTSPDKGYFSVAGNVPDHWHTTYDSSVDKYVSYSYDNGETWTTSNAITIDSNTVYNAIANNNNDKLGLFYSTSDGLRINASYITTGTLDASQISVTNLNASSIKAETLTVDRIRDPSGQYSIATSGLISSGYLNLNGYDNSDYFSLDSSGYATLYSPTIIAQKFTVKIPDANGNVPNPSSGVEDYGFALHCFANQYSTSAAEYFSIHATPGYDIPYVYLKTAGFLELVGYNGVVLDTGGGGDIIASDDFEAWGQIKITTAKSGGGYYATKYIFSKDGTGTDTGEYLWLGSGTYGGTGLAIDIYNGTLNFKNSSGWHDLLSGSGGTSLPTPYESGKYLTNNGTTLSWGSPSTAATFG